MVRLCKPISAFSSQLGSFQFRYNKAINLQKFSLEMTKSFLISTEAVYICDDYHRNLLGGKK